MYTYVTNRLFKKSGNVIYNAQTLYCKISMVVKWGKEPMWIPATYDIHLVQYCNKLKAPSSVTEC